MGDDHSQIEPVITAPNRIAYAEQMVHGRMDDQGQPEKTTFNCVLGDSAWLDVRSTQATHPVVEDELNALVDCLHQLQQQPAFTPAKVLVIFPFARSRTPASSGSRMQG